jgi:cell division inhibitor SulA/protein ImuA
METSSLEPCDLRAATTLVPRLRAAGTAGLPVWRGDEWNQAGTSADCAATGFEALDRELPGLGWPRGQLVELLVEQSGMGELGLLLPALAGLARTGRSCVWVLPCAASAKPVHGGADAADATPAHALPYAPALAEAGLDLTHHIFVKPLTARESGWALEQSLRTAHLGALIGWLPDNTGADADFRELRRLHLLAQRHRALVFILRTARHARSPSPAALRLRLQDDGGRLQVQVLKRRGRPLMEPVALQVHPSRWNRAPVASPAEALDSAVAAASRPALPASTAAGTAGAPWSSRLPTLRQVARALAPEGSGWAVPAAP